MTIYLITIQRSKYLFVSIYNLIKMPVIHLETKLKPQ